MVFSVLGLVELEIGKILKHEPKVSLDGSEKINSIHSGKRLAIAVDTFDTCDALADEV